MSESASFRILIIDDDIHKHVEGSTDWENSYASLTSQHCDFADYFLSQQDSRVEIVLAQDAALRKVFTLTPAGRIPHDRDEKNTKSRNPLKIANPVSWLGNFHIVVLDMGGIGAPKDAENLGSLIQDHFRAIKAPYDADALNSLLKGKEVEGVQFYHRYLDHFVSAKAIIVLTGYELGNELTPLGIRKLLWPFCRNEHDLHSTIRRTIILSKAVQGVGQRIHRIIKEYHGEFTGLAMLLNRSQIEFASVTDEPVLILGESGTGKEYVAETVRLAWEREKDAVKKAERGYTVLNCGCLTDETAHAHLFGAVRGAVPGSGTHQTGVILQAAGCRTLAYEKPGRPYDTHLKQALDRAANAAAKVEQLGKEQNKEKFFTLGQEYLADLRQLLYPRQSSHGGPPTEKDSLPRVLEEVRTHLQSQIAGTAEADQFKHKLRTHFGENLEEDRDSLNPYDLRFKDEAGVLGTLLLDEFADLPPLAQSLLLRFLESGTREIQPLGYPGLISGIKLRIIAATSDEEVAQKAGVTDLKKRPDGRARAFQVRFDLIQRLRYHTIRVEPVTGENARRTIESMIRTNYGVGWEEGAIDALEAYAKEEAGKDSFNHRRELRRIMDLATLLVTKGRPLGWRAFESNNITEEVVKRFLIPAPAVTPGRGDLDGPSIKVQLGETPKDPKDDKLRVEETKLREAIEKLIPALTPGWRHTDLAKSLISCSTECQSVQEIIQKALKTPMTEDGFFKRGEEDCRPDCGIAYALSLDKKIQYATVRKTLGQAGIKFEVRGLTPRL